jgi:glycosyltransferase involved in cell wall biosynthesis
MLIWGRMVASAPLVSVIMPCFNAGPMLRPALNSVVEQSYGNIEIVFVDNNSTDGSAETARAMLAAAGRPFTMTQCAAQGVNNARNWGYGTASGEYIQWLDADDTLDRDKIALQVAALERDTRDDIAYGDWTSRRTKPGGPRLEDRINLSQLDDQVLRTLAGVWYPPHLYLLRRSAAQLLRDEAGWWPARGVATDVEYSALAALLALRFRHVAGAHVHYNIWSDAQVSSATPYPKRVAGLKDIFRRLQLFAESGRAKAALTPRHKVLLYQGWDIWRMPRDSVAVVKLAGRRFRLRHEPTGREIEARPREAAIAKAMQATSRALPTCHHALMLAQEVREVANDHVTIVQTLERFQREGLLERIAAPEEETAARERG